MAAAAGAGKSAAVLLQTERTGSGPDDYMIQHLAIVVVGASGDLAKKKTYPALFSLYQRGLLPPDVAITGYARSKKTNEQLREQIRPYLESHIIAESDSDSLQQFLAMCDYKSTPGYDSCDGMRALVEDLRAREAGQNDGAPHNRAFYLAVPPFVFAGVCQAVHSCGGDSQSGWTRVVVEKPFGRNTATSDELSVALAGCFEERDLYRIDHYLGKEMVQSLLVLRFANQFFEPLWNHQYISSVYITFKEPFGTEGRGGYFDKYGIIRDVMQNHLLQVLSLIAMEPPLGATGNAVRDKKVELLRCIQPIDFDEVVLGQYVGSSDGSKPGYLDDDGVPNDSRTPTFASVVLRIRNRRWNSIPFIIRAGKAVDKRKVEVRIQFKAAPATSVLFGAAEVPRNELVIRMQPNEAIFMRTNVKAPGMTNIPVQSEMDLTYAHRYGTRYDNPDAYTRMLLNVFRGDQSTFVRNDELRVAWEIFTPLLERIEKDKSVVPIPYTYGSRGPSEADDLAIKVGYDARTLEQRLAAGSRDNRERGGSLTEREYKVYIGAKSNSPPKPSHVPPEAKY